MKVTKEAMKEYLTEMVVSMRKKHGFDLYQGTSQLKDASKEKKVAYEKAMLLLRLIGYCEEGLPSGSRFSKKSFLSYLEDHKAKCEKALDMIKSGNKNLIATPLSLNANISMCNELTLLLKSST